MLKKLGKPSLFDTPGKWIKDGRGKVRGSKNDASAVYKELFGKKRPTPPMTREEAAEILKQAASRKG